MAWGFPLRDSHFWLRNILLPLLVPVPGIYDALGVSLLFLWHQQLLHNPKPLVTHSSQCGGFPYCIDSVALHEISLLPDSANDHVLVFVKQCPISPSLPKNDYPWKRTSSTFRAGLQMQQDVLGGRQGTFASFVPGSQEPRWGLGQAEFQPWLW